MHGNQVKILNSTTFANPYFWFWGLRLPLLYVEQAVKTHPMVEDCFVYIHQDSDVNPQLLLVIEIKDYLEVKRKMDLLDDFIVVRGSMNIFKEIRDAIKKNSSDFIELHDVSFLSSNQRFTWPNTSPNCPSRVS